ncbi:MAG: hypothetical protein JW871_06575 [Endomicrobiales bacterium]|nr:hypothetical protein [Endomicrobiales bacterium]
MNRFSCFSKILLAVFLFSSCGRSTLQVKKNFNFNQIERIAVIKFDDYYGNPNSGKMAADSFASHFIGAGFNVIERSDMDKIMDERELMARGVVDTSRLKEIGKIYGVDALVIGSVNIFKEGVRDEVGTQIIERTQHGEKTIQATQTIFLPAEVGVTCKMLSIDTGEIIFIASSSFEGANTQTAMEFLASSIARKLRKYLK